MAAYAALGTALRAALLRRTVHAGLLRRLEVEALPAALAKRLATGDGSAEAERQRYISRARGAYVRRVASAAAECFAAWTPPSGAAAALATLTAAERQHAQLRRLAAGDGGGAANAPAAAQGVGGGASSSSSSPAFAAAQKELIRTADESLEEALEATSWAMQGHAELDAPAPQLVAGVALSLARAAAAAPPEDGGLPEALPPAFPEKLRELALFATKLELVGECALDEAQPPRRAALEQQLRLFGAPPTRKAQPRSRDARRVRPPRAMLRVVATPPPLRPPPLQRVGRRRVACALAAVHVRMTTHQLLA